MSAITSQGEPAPVEYLAPDIPKGLELGLRNYWYPVLRSEQLKPHEPLGFKVLGEALVAWRDAGGAPNVALDKCPHRSAKLSAGRVLNGELQCAWHGLRFDGKGKCVLIPWEEPDSRVLKRLGVQAYPARELGGWIWSYIGDVEKFPPPLLEDVMPEEFLHPEQFILFTHPIDVWKANWLQALDGSDGYHAVMLHSHSQPVAGEVALGGQVQRPTVPLAERRVKILQTPQGVRGVAMDPQGNAIHHGHFTQGWKGDRWTLPCLFTIPVYPAPNLPPYVARLYQFPIDATHTQTSRWVAMRAKTDEERAKCEKVWREIAGPRQLQVVAEDKAMIESLGDLVASRTDEHLLYPDKDVLTVRRMMAAAYLSQLNGVRPMPGKESFQFPY